MGKTKDVRCQCGNIIHVPLPVRLTDDGAKEIARLRRELEKRGRQMDSVLRQLGEKGRELEKARAAIDWWFDTDQTVRYRPGGTTLDEVVPKSVHKPAHVALLDAYAAREVEGRGDG